MIKIGINGFGRIGRAIFRNSIQFDDVQIVAINDINPENENLKYLLKYDSFYGRFGHDVLIDGEYLICDGNRIRVSHKDKIIDFPWKEYGCDVVIEAAGVHFLLDYLPEIINSGIKKIVVTYSPDKVDHSIVLGANEDSYDSNTHHIVSSNICDAVAFTPIYRMIDEQFGIENGFLTTLHPWLAYQNLLDGPPQSWGYPGSLYGHYSLGRAATASLILKPTTAITASDKIIPGIKDKMRCYSYRVPTPVVGVADITFHIQSSTNRSELISIFNKYIEEQKWPILFLNNDPLVSIDFIGTDYSAIIDSRWLEVINQNLIKITAWYDNEWGYSRRVVDVVRFLFNLNPQMHVDEKNSLS